MRWRDSWRRSWLRAWSSSHPVWSEIIGALVAIALVALLIVLLAGCAPTRTVLVPEDSPTRIGPDVRGRLYVLIDGEWVLGRNRVEVPEGWYLVPPSFVEATDAD